MPLKKTSYVSDVTRIGRKPEMENMNLERRSFKYENLKLILLMIVPVLGVVSLSAIFLNMAIDEYAMAKIMSTSIEKNLQLQSIIGFLQRERGNSAVYLSETGNKSLVYEKYTTAVSDTTANLYVENFPELINVDRHGEVMTKREWMLHLNNLRQSVFDEKIELMESLQIYTRIIQGIIFLSNEFILSISKEYDSCLNALLTSTDALLEATDTAGLQRALGAAYLQACRLSPSGQRWFFMLEGEEIAYLDTAVRFDSTLRADSLIEKASNRSIPLKGETVDFVVTCNNKSPAERRIDSTKWFNDLTAYLNILISVRKRQSSRLSEIYRIQSDEAYDQKAIMISLMSVVTIFSLVLGVLYLTSINGVMAKMRNYAATITGKSKELEVEKSKTDRLLYQMLPKEIADRLKDNQEVLAEHYDECTIYFSDIVGFTELGSKSTPFQIVHLLNQLYSLFDGYIDRRDVYKVETIGDAYMIVSGVPHRNGVQHVREIAKTAIDLRNAVMGFQIPHIKNEHLRIRIGVHTGACVAGVVGVKMPRYCLFGDTVNVAARMESTGEAMRIHVSANTHQRLGTNGDYKMERRGEIHIKGKGNMHTYWLEEKTSDACTSPSTTFCTASRDDEMGSTLRHSKI